MNQSKITAISCGLIFLVFLVAWVPKLNDAYSFEELYATKMFHHHTPFNPTLGVTPIRTTMDLSKHWKQYLGINPAGYITFYYFWSKLVGEDEVGMRLPLALLLLLSFFYFFQLINKPHRPMETLFIFSVFTFNPFWFVYGHQAKPDTFGFYFFIILLYWFKKSLEERKVLPQLYAINTLGLLFSYTFIYFALIQCLALFLGKEMEKRKKLITTLITICFIHLSIIMTCIPKYQNNIFTSHWTGPVALRVTLPFRFLIQGNPNERN